MKVLSLVPVVASLLAAVKAHTTVYGVWIDGEFQGDGRGVYVRSPPNNNPVKELNSTAIICNVNGATAVSSYVTVDAGATFEFEWYHDTRGDDIIAASHHGPILVYITPISTNGVGNVWTKIAEDGVSGGTWAVDKLIANKGRHSVVIPTWIQPGDYLIKAEIIALHEADVAYTTNSIRGAQFYPSCSQITTTGNGTTVPAQNFGFIGGYHYTDPGITYNVYTHPTGPYTIPGPPIWTP